jgi:hypothetical protein
MCLLGYKNGVKELLQNGCHAEPYDKSKKFQFPPQGRGA